MTGVPPAAGVFENTPIVSQADASHAQSSRAVGSAELVFENDVVPHTRPQDIVSPTRECGVFENTPNAGRADATTPSASATTGNPQLRPQDGVAQSVKATAQRFDQTGSFDQQSSPSVAEGTSDASLEGWYCVNEAEVKIDAPGQPVDASTSGEASMDWWLDGKVCPASTTSLTEMFEVSTPVAETLPLDEVLSAHHCETLPEDKTVNDGTARLSDVAPDATSPKRDVDDASLHRGKPLEGGHSSTPDPDRLEYDAKCSRQQRACRDLELFHEKERNAIASRRSERIALDGEARRQEPIRRLGSWAHVVELIDSPNGVVDGIDTSGMRTLLLSLKKEEQFECHC